MKCCKGAQFSVPQYAILTLCTRTCPLHCVYVRAPHTPHFWRRQQNQSQWEGLRSRASAASHPNLRGWNWLSRADPWDCMIPDVSRPSDQRNHSRRSLFDEWNRDTYKCLLHRSMGGSASGIKTDTYVTFSLRKNFFTVGRALLYSWRNGGLRIIALPCGY